MSLVTLAEAASFVENEDSKNEKNPRANSSISPVTSNTSDSDSEKGRRRPGGAGTREIHNRLEKNRRAQLKVCFETLKKEIPTLEDKRTSNLNILKSALRYIQSLQRETDEASKEREDLKKHNSSLREKLKALRNEIKILLDASAKNGTKNEGTLAIEAAVPQETTVALGSKVPPVSVATQTMTFAKKAKVEASASDDEVINVDVVTES